jgi:hypothetical protein
MESNLQLEEELIAGISEAYDTLINSLQPLNDTDFNKVPFEGSWSPAQVADHLIKASAGIPDKKTVAPDRPYNERIALLESTFLDFEKKLKAPDFILPESHALDKKEIIQNLQAQRSRHIYKIGKSDLTALCLGFELPHLGIMTRYEWYKFIMIHIKRHQHQLNNMLKLI